MRMYLEINSVHYPCNSSAQKNFNEHLLPLSLFFSLFFYFFFFLIAEEREEDKSTHHTFFYTHMCTQCWQQLIMYLKL